ncbi:MAG TPA: hypothetical protein VI386_33270 [Candidatus Sulfotelmatobacter sp.]
MTTSPDSAPSPVTSPLSALAAESLERACLALLCELAASLESSQRSLLALDVAGTEHCTREQIRLQRHLAALLPHSGLSPAAALQKQRLLTGLRTADSSATTHKIREEAERIRHLAHVQAALLRRAQQFTRVLANLIAGNEALYQRPTPSGGVVIGPASRPTAGSS